LHQSREIRQNLGVEGHSAVAGPGYVRHESQVEPRRESGTASVRVTIDASSGCELLEQSVIRYAPGRSTVRSSGDRQVLVYVAAGRGTLVLDGREHPLEPETGAFVGSGESYLVDNPGPDDLVLVMVAAPELLGHEAGERRTVRYADRPVLPAGADREFRFLVDKDMGCADITQFVGTIPPGRAPTHSHTYDEVIYVVEGEGQLHLGDRKTPIRAGTCIHLPPLLEHCLENTGANKMRVLGVFYPQGDPASRAYEATG
jgi:mannose-6-phosphate isomerase-like protein (cupin superfamily)